MHPPISSGLHYSEPVWFINRPSVASINVGHFIRHSRFPGPTTTISSISAFPSGSSTEAPILSADALVCHLMPALFGASFICKEAAGIYRVSLKCRAYVSVSVLPYKRILKRLVGGRTHHRGWLAWMCRLILPCISGPCCPGPGSRSIATARTVILTVSSLETETNEAGQAASISEL